MASQFETDALSHLDSLYGTALRLTRNEADAQDLVQDTFVNAMKGFPGFRGRYPGEFIAWLCTILANRLAAKASTIWDAVTRGRTNGALVMVYGERDPNISKESYSEQIKGFAFELLPVPRGYLP
jgi:DNA-directed RNA polymerase specialized sigma24 family protein